MLAYGCELLFISSTLSVDILMPSLLKEFVITFTEWVLLLHVVKTCSLLDKPLITHGTECKSYILIQTDTEMLRSALKVKCSEVM